MQRASLYLARALGNTSRRSIEHSGLRRFHATSNARASEPATLAPPPRYVRKFLLGATLASTVVGTAYYQLALNAKEQRRVRVQVKSFFRAFR